MVVSGFTSAFLYLRNNEHIHEACSVLLSRALYFMPQRGQEALQQWASGEPTHPATGPSTAVPAAVMSSAPFGDCRPFLLLFFFLVASSAQKMKLRD